VAAIDSVLESAVPVPGSAGAVDDPPATDSFPGTAEIAELMRRAAEAAEYDKATAGECLRAAAASIPGLPQVLHAACLLRVVELAAGWTSCCDAMRPERRRMLGWRST
jgi:hypothetical protein